MKEQTENKYRRLENIEELEEGDLLKLSHPRSGRVDRIVEIKEDEGVYVKDQWDDGVRTSESDLDRLQEHINGETSWTPLVKKEGDQ